MSGFLVSLNKLLAIVINLPIFREFKFIEKFIKFSLVGLVNTIIDFSIFFGLTRLLVFFEPHYLLANLLAFTIANMFSFIANKHWTFGNQSKSYLAQYYKFLSVSLLALAAVQLTLYLLISSFGVWDLVAKIAALLVSVIIGFLGSRWWAFK